MVRIKSLLNILSTAVACLAMASVLPYLEPAIGVFACVGVLAGVWCDRREQYLLNSVTATLVAVASIVYWGIQVTRADVATPVVKVLIVLLVVRLLTPKESRDYLQVFVLALFVLAGASLVSLDLGLGFGFLTYLVLMVFCVTLGLVMLTVFVTDRRLALPRRDLYQLVKVSLIMPVVSLVLMVVFFFVLPRTRHPLWSFLNPAGQAKSGIAESVQPGTYARISAADGLAFRAEVEELAPEDLYWRALVLNKPEGATWVREERPHERSAIVNSKRAVKVTVYSEPRADRYLISLDRPSLLTGVRLNGSGDGVYVARNSLGRSFKLNGLSHIGADLSVTGLVDQEFYLSVPEQVSDRMRRLGKEILRSSSSKQERIAELAEFFRTQELVYAQDDLPGGSDPIDSFLFDKKRGYCEFFASAYVTMARLAGVPARLVGGYFGGEYNRFGGYYLVTEDTAHVWVEVLTEKNHWVRIDPSQWAINAASALGDRQRSSLNALQKMIDSLNYRWTQSILLFDFARQVEFLSETREQFRRLDTPDVEFRLGYWLVGVGGILVVIVLVRYSKRVSPEEYLLELFRSRLRKRFGDHVISSTCGLEELGERLDSDICREFAEIYQGAVFRDRSLSASEQLRLKELIKKI